MPTKFEHISNFSNSSQIKHNTEVTGAQADVGYFRTVVFKHCVTPDVICLQLCTPQFVCVQFKLYTVYNLYLKQTK
jgi:hypothetical protein